MARSFSRRTLLAAAGGLLSTSSLNLLAGGHQSGPSTRGMLRLIANENPYGPSPAAREAAQRAVANGWKYALRETGRLKKLLADHEGVEPNQIMVSTGSSEALRVTAMVYGRAGGRVVSALPTFSFLPIYARRIGCTVDEIPLTDSMSHDLDKMASAIRPDTRLVYVCNPNNPTGTLVSGEELSAFIDTVSDDAPVLVDEAYLDLWDDLPKHTVVDRVRAGRPVIVTRTFSKLHGMAGLRVGYAIAPAGIIEQLEALRVTNMSLPGVLAASASIQDQEFLTLSRRKIRECLALTYAVFDELNLTFVRSRGNFVYFDTGGSPREFMTAMRGRGILTGMSYAPYPSWARVSMGRVEEMQTFASAARDYFG